MGIIHLTNHHHMVRSQCRYNLPSDMVGRKDSGVNLRYDLAAALPGEDVPTPGQGTLAIKELKKKKKCLRQTPCQGEIRIEQATSQFLYVLVASSPAVTHLPVTSVGRQPLAHLFQGAFSLPELLQQMFLPRQVGNVVPFGSKYATLGFGMYSM